VDVKPCLQEILSYIESHDFADYDPYDALNSPLLRSLGINQVKGQANMVRVFI